METGIVSLPAASIITAIIGSILFSFIWKINKQSAGIFEWMLAIIIFPIALLFQGIQEGDSLGLTIFMTNILMAGGAIFVTIGTRKFFGREDDNTLLSLVMFIPFSVGCFYFTFVEPDVSVRLQLMSLFWIASLLLSLVATVSPKSHACLAGRVIFSTFCILLIGFMIFQIYSVFNLTQVASLFSSSIINILIDISGFIAHYGFTLSFCILYLERKEQQLGDLKRTIYTRKLIDNEIGDAAAPIECPDLSDVVARSPQNERPELNDKIEDTTQIERPEINDIVTEQELPQARKNVQQAVIMPEVQKDTLQPCAFEKPQAISAEQTSAEVGTPTNICSSPSPLQANLLNPVPLQRQQQKLEQQEFVRRIQRLPQHLKHLTDIANEAFEKRESEKLKETLHKLAISADKTGLEQLAEMALTLELNSLADITTQTFKQLEMLCNASIRKLQHSDFYN